MLGSNKGVRVLEVLRHPHLNRNELMGLTTVAPADRFHVFHSFTFEKLSCPQAVHVQFLSVFVCSYLCTHVWNTVAIFEFCKSEINTFSLFFW